MRVFLDPAVGLHSRAMVRIADALSRHAPPEVEIVSQIDQSDLAIFYPIGFDWVEKHIAPCISAGCKYALVQCCLQTSGASAKDWLPWWNAAVSVWSYYDLYSALVSRLKTPSPVLDFDFYYAPLGIDPAFLDLESESSNRDQILTTGYVHGRPAESILEPWIAAREVGLKIVHVGGWPTTIPHSEWKDHVRILNGISDQELALEYSHSKYVCSLRYVEGFELPAAEGLACGARPVLFSQPDLRYWYGSSAVYVPEDEGEKLTERLIDIFRSNYPVSSAERRDACRFFDWSEIAAVFWKRLLRSEVPA